MKSERYRNLLAISVLLLVAAGVSGDVGLTGNFVISDQTSIMAAPADQNVDKPTKMSSEVAELIPPSGLAAPTELLTVNIYLNSNKTEDIEVLENHTAEIMQIKENEIVAMIYTSEIVDIANLSFVTYMDIPLQAQLFSNAAVGESRWGGKDSKISTKVADSIPPPGIAPPDKPMIVNLYLTGNETEEIEALQNCTIELLSAKAGKMVAKIYTREIVDIADLSFISYMDTPIKAQVFHEAAVESGIPCINVDKQHMCNIKGKDVQVAIIDLGFAGYADLLGTDLPENVTVMSFRDDGDITGGGAIRHGTACAEIVHDVAPDAELYLISYDGYAYQLEKIVDYLVSEAVDIVSHSAGGTAGLFDGTDQPCRIIDDAVFEHGIKWVNAAGNCAQGHWEGIFNDSDCNCYHEFPDGELGQMFCAEEGEFVSLALSWDDTWSYATQDYDLYVLNSSESVVAKSENPQDGIFGHVPVEGVSFVAPCTDYYYIMIANFNATKPVHLELYSMNHDLDCKTENSSLCVEAAALGSITVGAVTCDDCSTLEPYSSRGPTNDGRIKPDYVGPGCVSTSAYTPYPFCGTSVATPHVAGAFALQMSYNKSSPGQENNESACELINPYLNETANSSQRDNQYGYGLPMFFKCP
ncbi:Serine protease, subtilisin family [Methanophagales archaeon]|nr:Serine protease, subtilisin family [Methanophagales archaeon]